MAEAMQSLYFSHFCAVGTQTRVSQHLADLMSEPHWESHLCEVRLSVFMTGLAFASYRYIKIVWKHRQGMISEL